MTRDDVMRSTMEHKLRVADLMMRACEDLQRRAVHHDDSKFSEEEFPAFVEATPILAQLTYGSDEYKASLAKIKPAVQTHYQRNRHHPEHHVDGVDGMNLMDLLEMLCDWKAAGERHADGGCIRRSMEHNRERFNISPQLEKVLMNTADEFLWINQGAGI